MNRASETRPAPLRLIDTLTFGFNLAVGSLAAITLAFLLDLLYWLGPRVTLGPAWVQVAETQLATLPFEKTTLDALQENIRLASTVNLLQSLSGVLGLGGVWPVTVPSLVASDPVLTTLGPSWELPSLGVAVALFPVLLIVGCLLGSVYLTLVAALVRGEKVALVKLVPWMLGTWGRLLALNGLVLALLFMMSLPFSVAWIIANLIHPMLGLFVVVVTSILAVWVWVHGFLTVPALVLDKVNPFRAYWRSYRVMGRNMWSALGLVSLSFVLNTGLSEVWGWLGETTLGAPIGMVGQAFVGTALTAALLAFYHDRQKTT